MLAVYFALIWKAHNMLKYGNRGAGTEDLVEGV